jgi:long-chain acyl-CoA synthetase
MSDRVLATTVHPVSAADIDAIVGDLTAPKRLMQTAAAHPDLVALRSWRDGVTWNEWTLAETLDLVARAAAGYHALGVEAGERVLLMMRNRPDFHWFDIAAQFVRATPVSIYNSSAPEEIQFLAGDAAARIAILEDRGFLDRMLSVRDELPLLRHIFVIEPGDEPLPDGVSPASDLLEHGRADLDELAAATRPDDLATLIYTSGTTGPPKGVMISQHNVVFTVEQLRQVLVGDRWTDDDLRGMRAISYLPMAHIAERMCSLYQAMILGYEVYCCPNLNELSTYLPAVRPQFIFGVPRVYEKIYSGVNAVLAADPERKRQFDEAVAAAIPIKEAETAGTITPEQTETWDFLDAVAFSTARNLIGLDEARFVVTGAAPIPKEVLRWFTAIGVPLSEIYGMSESSGPMTWSPHRSKIGYVGQTIPGQDLAIAADGEVIVRGGNVFVGYLNQPEKTAQTVIDGWLHSGDIGEIDSEGYLRIVDRKKELIITSGGKNISPANLEASLKMIPLVGQAAAIGDARKFVTAILVLDPDATRVWAAEHGKANCSMAELAADPDVLAEVQAGVDQANEQFASVEQIKKFTLVGEEWLPDSDVLTPTQKLKRRGINARYADHIEAMYAGD